MKFAEPILVMREAGMLASDFKILWAMLGSVEFSLQSKFVVTVIDEVLGVVEDVP